MTLSTKCSHQTHLIIQHFLLLCCIVSTIYTQVIGTTRAANITSPPTMIKQPEQEQLFQIWVDDSRSHEFRLECEAQGLPEPRYWWTKNGARFDYVPYDKRISQEPRSGSLIFKRPENVDEGLYQCFAENEFGTSVSNSVFLRRAELSSFPEEPPREYTVDEGSPFTIDCSPPSGYPKPDIFWMILSDTGALHSINSSRLAVDPEGKLHFSNITKADQLENAHYACSASSPNKLEYKLGRKTRLTVQSSSTGSNNHHPPEMQYLSPPIVSALRGQELSLHCIYGGTPLPEIVWRKKGGSLEGNKIAIKNYGKTLTIYKIDHSDEGTYECTASNGHGSQLSHAMTVTVSAAPYWIRAPNNTNAAQEESVQFECLSEGKPKPNLKWLLNGVPLDTQKRPSIRIDSNTLYIDSLRKSDMGVYQCNSSNVHGYAFRDFYLNVLDLPPIVLEAPEKIARAVLSSTVILKCRVFGAPKPKIKWRRDNIELSGGRYKVLENGDLQIESLLPTDQGIYQCKAANKFDEVTIEGELHVKGRTKIIQAPENIELPASKMAVFRCNAESDPTLPQEVNWLYNGKPIDSESDPRMVLSRDNSLSISKTKELDSGNYTCVAKTPLDSVSASATLTVQDVPNPPKITNLDCESFKATIQWTSTGDRRAPILSYDIQQNTSDAPDTWDNAFYNIPASDPRFSLTLQPWLNYTFRVIARNKIGQSLPSGPSQTCTTEKSQPTSNPNDVKGRGSAPNNLVISWTIMDRKQHNAPGFHYKVYWKRADVPDAEWNSQVINDWKESRLVISNQPTFVPYKIKVEAHNSLGQSTMDPDEVTGYSGQDIPSQEPRNFRLVRLVTPSKGIFSWDPVPPDSIRGRFKGYKIQAWTDLEEREFKMQEVILGNVTSLEVDILRPYSNNTVQIMATNDLFAGPPSLPVTVTTPEGIPDAVTFLKASPMGSNAFYLIWKRPEKANGKLIGYEIYYEEVIGTELKERVKRRPSIDEPNETKAKLAGLKPKSKYRITIVGKTIVGEGLPYFIEASTNDIGDVVPDEPAFIWSKLPEEEGSFGVRITWLPNYVHNRPGSSFYVQFRKLGQPQWHSTTHESNTDTINIKGLDLSSIYEVRVTSVDGRHSTSSKIEEIATNGYIYGSYSDPLSDPGWLVGLLCALFLVLCIFILVCVIKQNRGGKYLVHEKEIALGQDPDDYKDGFDEYNRSSASRPLRNDDPSINSLGESDEDSLTDYEGDKSKFEEDGSFIGQYGVKKRPDLPTIQNQRVATFV